MTKNRQNGQDGQARAKRRAPLHFYGIAPARSDEEAAAFRAAARAAGVEALETPELMAIWTGDINRFKGGRDCAVVIEKEADGGNVINASPRFEERTIEFLKETSSYYEGVTSIRDPRAEEFSANNRAEGLTSRLVILGTPEKFNNGKTLHGMTFTRGIMQHLETRPEEAPDVIQNIEKLYNSGMMQRAKIRVIRAIYG